MSKRTHNLRWRVGPYCIYSHIHCPTFTRWTSTKDRMCDDCRHEHMAMLRRIAEIAATRRSAA